jgi:AcrR family transcriptional regulator
MSTTNCPEGRRRWHDPPALVYVAATMSSETRTRLLRVGAQLVRDDRRDLSSLFDGITLSSVARVAGVSRNTIRRYYPTKADFIAGLIEYLLITYLKDEYVIGDEEPDSESRFWTFALPPIEEPTLADLVQAFGNQELERWGPQSAAGHLPIDDNLLFLHILVYLVDHPSIATEMRRHERHAFESLATNVYVPTFEMLGIRPRPPLTAIDIAEMVGAVFDGYCTRQIVSVETALRPIEFDGRTWSGATLGAWAIIDRLTEPTPSS